MEIGERYGFIRKSGEFAIEPRFETASDFRRGVARVRLNGTNVKIDQTGNLLPETYDEATEIEDLGEGMAKIESGEDLWRLSNSDGATLTDCEYEYLGAFKEGMAIANYSGRWQYLDKSGQIVFETNFSIHRNFSCGLAAVRDGGKWGYIDKTGRLVIPCQFSDARDFQQVEA